MKNKIFSIADRISYFIEDELNIRPKYIMESKRHDSKYLHYMINDKELVVRVSTHNKSKKCICDINIIKPEESKIDLYGISVMRELLNLKNIK